MPGPAARFPEPASPNDARLELDARFTHVADAGDRVVLVGDDDPVVLELRAVADIVRLLDGTRTAVGIASELEDRYTPALVHFALLALERRGIARAASAAASAPIGATETDRDESALARRLRDAWEGRRGARLLRLPIGPPAEHVQLVLTDDYLNPDLAVVKIMEPTVLARVGPGRVWAGPVIVPGAGPCLACLLERLRLNLTARALIHLQDGGSSDGVAVRRLERATPTRAYERLAGCLRRILDEVRAGSPCSRIEVVPLESAGTEVHTVVRLPQCPSCGDPSRSVPGAAIELRSRRPRGRSRAGNRVIDPSETFRRLSHHISPLTGVVRHVRNVPVNGTDLVHVYTARHALHNEAATLRTVKSAQRDPSGGKGMTDLDARVSALCESLERFSGVYRGGESLLAARLSQLGDRGIAPNDLLLYSERQFAERKTSNAADASGFQHVPEPYDDEPIEWAEARSLVTGQTRFVPAACLYLGFKGTGRRFARGDSNGLAGGNCLEEAILQGFFELVERDAIALWWYNRVRRPAVDLESFHDPWTDRLRVYYATLGRSLWALDLTTDIGIPCFAALSHRLGGACEDIIFGFGCHLDPAIAALRALTELNQMLPTIVRSPDERRRQLLPEFGDAVRWWDSATIEAHPYLAAGEAVTTTAARWPTPDHDDLRESVLHCVARARAVGCDFLVCDLTRPDIGFSVARVVVPGMRHFWRRLGPGRLYEVPVRLGWVERIRTEEQMNPVSMFV